MRRELDGYKEIKIHQFTGETFSAVLGEVALFAASVEKDYAEFHIVHEWNEDDGHVVFLYEQYS